MYFFFKIGEITRHGSFIHLTGVVTLIGELEFNWLLLILKVPQKKRYHGRNAIEYGFCQWSEVPIGGDLIVKEDNAIVTNASDVIKVLTQKKVGDIPHLTLFRVAKPMNINVTLEQTSDFKISYPSSWKVISINDNLVRFNPSFHGSSDSSQENFSVEHLANSSLL